MRNLILILSLSLSIPAWSQEFGAPLVFKEWKNQQVLDAQNQVLRASTRVTQLRAGKPAVTPKKSARLPNDKVREATEDDLTVAERDLKHAQDGLTTSTNLTFSNYIDVYLPVLKDNPAALAKLAEKLSKEELGEIFKALMKSTRDLEGRRVLPVLPTLVSRARPRA